MKRAVLALAVSAAVLPAVSDEFSGSGLQDDATSGFVPLDASGGTIFDTTIGGRAWRYHVFNASGTFTVNSIGTDPNVRYLAVGSGASGAHHDQRVGMGGGAGGMVREGTFTPSATGYSIVVGAPGAGVNGSASGNNGADVTGFSITAEGGRAGGGYFTNPGNGVNGGGGGCTLTTGSVAGGTGTNFAGGNGRGNSTNTLIAGGGGAGAGGPGGNAADSLGGTAGLGVASDITGVSLVYGAGAGGNALTTGGSGVTGGVAGVGHNIAPNAGTDGRGNGGSGASGTGPGAFSAPGGKGTFIVGYWMAAA